MAEQNSSLVARQWEAPATLTGARSIIEALVTLNKAVSQDEIQQGAVTALQDLGVLCLVSPDLIGEGVDALKGNESVRVRDTKLLIGLSNGGTVSFLRKSTSCVQGFLLIAALEICGYDPKEVGQFLFRMMTHADVLKNDPVSPKQLQALVGVISGHCHDFIKGSGSETLNEIINSVANLRLKAAHWHRLSHDAMARLFVKVFKALQDEEIHYVEISGSTGLIWIALSLLWLNRDKVSLFREEKCIIGQADSKIRIFFSLYDESDESDESDEIEFGSIGSEQDGWVFKTWKSGQSVPQLIRIPDESASAIRFDSLTMIPARTTYKYYLAMFGSDKVVQTLGGVAISFVRAALEVGPICSKPDYVRQPLSSLVNKHPLNANTSDGSPMLEHLGWTLTSGLTPSLNAKHDSLSLCILGKCSSHGCVRPETRVEDHLNEIFMRREDELLTGIFMHAPHIPTFLQACLSLAAQLFASLFVRPILSPSELAEEAKSKYLQTLMPFFNVRRQFDSFWTSTMFLPVDQKNNLQVCKIDSLREEIFRIMIGSKSLPTHGEKKRPVAVTAGGRTGILSPLCETWIDKVGILDVCVIPGNIRFNNVNFDVVVEDVSSNGDTRTIALSQIFEKNSDQWKVTHDFAEEDSVLLMRTSITSPSPKMTHISVSYTECINEIACCIGFSRFKAQKSSALTGEVAMTDVIEKTAIEKISQILTRQDNIGDRQPRFVDILFTRDPPWQFCSADSEINPEVFFFATHARFLPKTTALVLLQDFKIEESLYILVQRAVKRDIHLRKMKQHVGRAQRNQIDVSEVEKFATEIVSRLPGFRFITPAQA